MKPEIKKLKIYNLFNTYDYEINLCEDNLTIIHSANGKGKTTILKLINYVLSLDLLGLFEIKFEKIEFYYSDKRILIINQDSNSENIYFKFKNSKNNIEINFHELKDDINCLLESHSFMFKRFNYNVFLLEDTNKINCFEEGK